MNRNINFLKYLGLNGEQHYDAYSPLFFTFCGVAIRCNNGLLRLIAPCQK